jgi:hypothetical protein
VGALPALGLGQVLADHPQHSAWGVVDRLQLGRARGRAAAVAQGAADGAKLVGQANVSTCGGMGRFPSKLGNTIKKGLRTKSMIAQPPVARGNWRRP